MKHNKVVLITLEGAAMPNEDIAQLIKQALKGYTSHGNVLTVTATVFDGIKVSPEQRDAHIRAIYRSEHKKA